MNPYRELSDEELLGQCRVELRRASGPGGQHRNKVETAVRLLHLPTGVTANGSERRSQSANRDLALERLRLKLARLFHRQAPRVKTRKSRGVRARELEQKRRASARKAERRERPRDD